MDRAWSLGALLIFAIGCGAGGAFKNKAGGAATAVGVGVAAAGFYRATTGGCWATCQHGLACDEASGTCVPVEPSAVRVNRTQAAASSAGQAAAVSGGDACRGLCLAGEVCVVDAGVADCVPDAPAAPGR
jgi:hypothetical protein